MSHWHRAAGIVCDNRNRSQPIINGILTREHSLADLRPSSTNAIVRWGTSGSKERRNQGKEIRAELPRKRGGWRESLCRFLATDGAVPSNELRKRPAIPQNQLFFGRFRRRVFQSKRPSYSQAPASNYTPVLFHKQRAVADSASRQTGKHSAQPQGANRNNKQQVQTPCQYE